MLPGLEAACRTKVIQSARRFDVNLAVMLAVDGIERFPPRHDIASRSRGRRFGACCFRYARRLRFQGRSCLRLVATEALDGVVADIDGLLHRCPFVLDVQNRKHEDNNTVHPLLPLCHLKLHDVTPFVG